VPLSRVPRLLLLSLLVLISGLGAAAQQPPAREARPGVPTGTATIRGRVLAADTGKPLPRVLVVAAANAPGVDLRRISTNAKGEYELRNLPAGQYILTVTRDGYLPLRWGQRRPREPGKPIDVPEGATIQPVDFALPRTSVIAGQIIDDLGDPVPDVAVSVMRPSASQQEPVVGISSTDDDGQYRFPGLEPGSYVIAARSREVWTARDGAAEQRTAYAPTYFPGTTNPAEARRVPVGVGQESVANDFALIPGRAATLSGTATDSSGRPLDFVVLMEQIRGDGMIGVASGGPSVRTADGSFVIRDVLPGEYLLQAAGREQLARAPIAVDGADISGIVLTAASGWSMTGRLIVENGGASPTPREGVRIGVRPVERQFTVLSGQPIYEEVLNRDWTFSASGLVGPGRVRVVLPPGWIVKAVVHEGRDFTGKPMETAGGRTLSGVQVVLSREAGAVRGRIVDEQGATAVDGTVIMFAEDRERWFEQSPFVHGVRTDQNGRFTIGGLTPGRYLAAAVDFVEAGAWWDPAYLESLRAVAQPLTVEARDLSEIELRLIVR
jgi:protocatechuate 3,4-dioxygenase beta subunit